MVSYTVNNKIYDLPEEEVDGFLNEFPNAVLTEEDAIVEKPLPSQQEESVTVEESVTLNNTESLPADTSSELPVAYKVNDKIYDLPKKEVAGFLNEFPDAVPYAGKESIQELQSKTPDEKPATGFFNSMSVSFLNALDNIELQKQSAELQIDVEEEELDPKNVTAYVKAIQNVNDNQEIQSIKDYDAVVTQHEKDGGNGFIGVLKGLAAHPEAGFPMAINSFGTMVGSLAVAENLKEIGAYGAAGATLGAGIASVAGTAVLPVVGTAVGAAFGAKALGARGLYFGMIKQMETNLFFTQLLNENIEGEITDEKVAKVFEDQEFVEDMLNKANNRGLGVAAIEVGLSFLPGKVAGKIMGTLGRAGAGKIAPIVAGGVGAVVTEAGVGMLGEATGQIASGQEINLRDITEEGIISPYGKATSLSGYVSNVRTFVDEVKVSSTLKPTKYNNISELYSNEITDETQIKLSKLKRSQKLLDLDVNRRVNNNEITKEEGDNIKNNFRATQGAVNRVKSLNFNTEQETKAVELLKEKNKLINQIEEVNDAALTGIEKERVDAINKELGNLNVERASQTVAEAIDASRIIVVENAKELEDKYKIKDVGNKQYSKAGGFFENGKLYINKEKAGTIDIVTEAGHELLHPVLKEALKADLPGLVGQFKEVIGPELTAEVDAIIEENPVYNTDYMKANPDEFITQFFDLSLDTKRKSVYNDNFLTKIGDFITPLLRKFGFKKIKFDTGKDVYNFMREYSRNIKEGKLSEDVKAVIPKNLKTNANESTQETDTNTALSVKRATVLEAVNKLVPQDITTKAEWEAFKNTPRAFPKLFNAINEQGGVINNYIRSISTSDKEAKATIERLVDRTLKFNPEALRADETAVGIEAFGERIFADIQYARKGSKLELYEESEKIKQEKRKEDREDGFETLAAPEVEVEVEVAKTTSTKATRYKELKNSFLPSNVKTKFENFVSTIIGKLKPENFTFKNLPNFGKLAMVEAIGIVPTVPFKELVKGSTRQIGTYQRLLKASIDDLINQGVINANVKNVDVSNRIELQKVLGNDLDTVIENADFLYKIDKLRDKANFTQLELDKIITYLEKNLSDIKLGLPGAAVLEGSKADTKLFGTSTGVAKNLLQDKNLYEKLDRGTRKSGLAAFKKLKGIDPSSIRKAMGIVNEQRTAGTQSKAAQTIKGLINAMANVITNQEVRAQLSVENPIINVTENQLRDTRAGGIDNETLFSAKGKAVSDKIIDKGFRKPQEIKKARKALIEVVKLLGIKNSIQNIVPTARRSGAKETTYEVIEEIGNELKTLELDGLESTRYFLVKNQKDFVNNILKVAFPNDDIKLINRNQAISVNGTEIRTPKFTKIPQSPKGFIKGDFVNNIQERVNFASKQRVGMKGIVENLTLLYNSKIINDNQLFMILQTFNSSVEALIRTAAIPKYYFKGTGKVDADYRYEHVQTASDTLTEIFRSIVTPNNRYSFDQIMQGFDVAIIPKVYDDIINTLFRSDGPKLDGTRTGKLILGKGLDIKRYINPKIIKAIKEAGLPPLKLKEFNYSLPEENKNLVLSVKKAANKNNNKLPASQKLPKDSTNEQVLAKMRELDNQANEARAAFSVKQDLDDDFNKIIESKTGIKTYKRFDRAGATVKGASKGKFNFFIPPSAEDFVGLLYKTLARGKLGDIQMQWFKDNLINPYARAMNNVSSARVAMFEDYKTLKNDLKIIPKDLKKKSFDEYTKEQAVRVYIWDQQGNKIPGIFKTNQQSLVDYVNNNAELKAFADQLVAIQKGDQYSSPNEGWLAGSITTDLLDSVNSVKRKKYLEQWQTNVDEIFGETNMNKLEAAFGKPYREALTNILTRMKTGRNKPFTSDSLAGRFTNWLNNSVGAIMFFNTRSAVLQLLSSINFVNFTDNNPLKAGVAFANQPQYWKDFKFLFNSDFLKERRGGLRFNVSESEIADAAQKGGAKGVISKILQAGFLPTQMADSFAIATGGATFYRNRVKTYIKQGLTEAEANEKAFEDFRETAEESQQSSRPDRISAQQAGPLGRTILAFANTPAQYARLTKKAASDIINGRGDLKTNISKLAYYGAVQNLMFNFLQQAVFALAFGDESDEEEKKKEEKLLGVANGMADSFLRGIGIAGAITATLKNALIRIIKESEKARPDYAETTIIQLLGISPPVQSKAQKIRSALKSYEWNKDEMKEKGFSLDNPAYLAGANVISASTNVPLDRVIKKVDNIRNSTQDDISTLNRIMLLAGWADWQLGIQKEEPKKSKNSRVKVRKSSSRTGKRKVTIR